jgi:hypothetical protein
MSYRWNDHAEGSKERNRVRNLVSNLMVKKQTGVWLDNLTLPASNIDKQQSDAIIEKLLRGPLQSTPLLVAHITTNYGGPSADLGPCEPGYTLLEWRQAKKVFAWKESRSRYANLLKDGVKPCHTSPPKHSLTKVARAITDSLGRPANRTTAR